MARSLVLLLGLLAVSAGNAERLRKQTPPEKEGDVSETMARLQPVLDKLRNLDPKSFGALSGMMNQVQGNAKPASFLQFVKDDPQAVSDKLAALAPVLDKLRNLDPKSFGALSSMMNQAQQQAKAGSSFIQQSDEPKQQDVTSTIDRLQPVLDKLRNLDPKAFGAMSSMIDKASQENLSQK